MFILQPRSQPRPSNGHLPFFPSPSPSKESVGQEAHMTLCQACVSQRSSTHDRLVAHVQAGLQR
eukprot:6195967-Pleurochrysis_carterae.AAC.1